MKSIANQYIALKEGRLSQANFMRSVRMSLPQYVTNLTSFSDAVKILKNKRIITEMYDGPSEPSMGDERLGDYYEAVSEELESLAKTEYNLDDVEIEQMFESEWHSGKNDDAIEMYYEEGDDPSVVASRILEDYMQMEDNVASQIDRMEDEESGKYTKFQDFEGGLSEGKKKRAKKEEKPPLNPNTIHPSELRMGIKVEMEHTDDPKKAEKIALDHLAENPYYYTALKLAGVESPSAPKAKPVAPKKIKKKDATEMTDPANQMQKVKLMKESLEKLIREEFRK